MPCGAGPGVAVALATVELTDLLKRPATTTRPLAAARVLVVGRDDQLLHVGFQLGSIRELGLDDEVVCLARLEKFAHEERVGLGGHFGDQPSAGGCGALPAPFAPLPKLDLVALSARGLRGREVPPGLR